MRIISGEFKGRQLKAVPGMNTRPTSDKVREAFFHGTGPYFEGGLFLDLFGGSGAVGLEALSRGFERAVFVERNGKAFAVLKENVNKTGAGDRAELYRSEAGRALKAAVGRELVFDMIYMDPPYDDDSYEEKISYIADNGLLHSDGLLAAEHRNDKQLPEEISGLKLLRRMDYGSTALTLYQH
ncbi:16S rRNA (guanine(966)-N(2))-methyltransferase RsmD [Alkalicoccus luteus]|uniref:16S rRNA (Guanine(966)-N(2))-methyltransferase RsmD n=1 Tax=Alkalicoccus luteus TaxID=1237094 RepID=A0A969PN55_9BACI|nr:16S rRNA (guanine(966)-N(2))-methyltransferase RsmD [Alkalicoccus luteus]NJP36465.1 16S rRNA (guanine(966)-N(2))-methyltransferase RsmD [Alkalicoccus luteus]